MAANTPYNFKYLYIQLYVGKKYGDLINDTYLHAYIYDLPNSLSKLNYNIHVHVHTFIHVHVHT